eukprot:m.74468 g.74468  ORF g.74468 m.74468 type:complete len:70 (+) comp8453_c5_seq3:5458-5667(+)
MSMRCHGCIGFGMVGIVASTIRTVVVVVAVGAVEKEVEVARLVSGCLAVQMGSWLFLKCASRAEGLVML